MAIQTYFNQIKDIFDQYATANVVLDATLKFDLRPGDQGYWTGTMVFINGSLLYVKEFLNESEGNIEKMMYSYHYQDASKHLIFRYDNAYHKPPLSSREHKHVHDSVCEAATPMLDDVLLDVFLILRKQG